MRAIVRDTYGSPDVLELPHLISEKTVKSHVGNILSKLHLEDRTQAAVFAWREGLVQPPDDQKTDHSMREK